MTMILACYTGDKSFYQFGWEVEWHASLAFIPLEDIRNNASIADMSIYSEYLEMNGSPIHIFLHEIVHNKRYINVRKESQNE
jgi:hypothetical protein